MSAPATLDPQPRAPLPVAPGVPAGRAARPVARLRRLGGPGKPGRAGGQGRPGQGRWRPGPYASLASAALLLALGSLALPSAPSYDPWAWIVWGREVVHLSLVTTGGPTWKPLPVLFTTLFAPFGSAAPSLWLIVARAGGIAGVGMSAALAFRLTRAGSRRRAPAAFAAALAGIGAIALSGYVDSVASGESEGLLVALLAGAILRHLDGAPRQSLALGFAAALIRPEAWPFLGLYGIYLWRRDPGTRTMIAALFALIPTLWFLPELWGARSVLRGVEWAQYPRAGSPAFAKCPLCAEITGHAWPLVVTPFKLGAAFALGCAVLAPARRANRAVVWVAAAAFAWTLEEAVLTQVGFSGSDRYLIAPAAALIVVGSIGWGWALRRARGRIALAGLAALLIATAVWDAAHLANLATTESRQRTDAQVRRYLPVAVRRAGGPARLIACGSIQTNPSGAPLAAWALGVQMRWTENAHGHVLIQSRNAGSGALAPSVPRGAGYRLIASAGTVKIFEKCV